MSKLYIFFFILYSVAVNADDFRAVPAKKMDWDVSQERTWCTKCGMNLSKFYKTSHVLHSDNKNIHTCSLHCLADVMKNNKGTPKVVDVDSLKLINAKKAFYVVGSKKPGTMSMVSKYAFKSKQGAESFQKKFGGKIVSFKKALMMANKTFYKEAKMISMKRNRKMYPMGKKIYMHKCNKKKVDALVSKNVAALKFAIKNGSLCGDLKPMQLQMVALYVKFGKKKSFTVPKNAKCPICGMFVAKHPKWSVKLAVKDKNHYFDGSKDFFKFYLKNRKGIATVKDYYSLTDVDAKKAYYVIGSDIYGPMGHELIPFKSMNSAKNFMKEHKGQRVLKFSDVTPSTIKKLD